MGVCLKCRARQGGWFPDPVLDQLADGRLVLAETLCPDCEAEEERSRAAYAAARDQVERADED